MAGELVDLPQQRVKAKGSRYAAAMSHSAAGKLKPGVDAPRHLRAPTREWFASVVRDFELEEHHRRLLVLCAEAWDRCQQARECLQEHGLTFTDRWGQPHARPEVSIERDSRIAYARLLRELDLDIDGPPDRSRPPALRSNRR